MVAPVAHLISSSFLQPPTLSQKSAEPAAFLCRHSPKIFLGQGPTNLVPFLLIHLANTAPSIHPSTQNSLIYSHFVCAAVGFHSEASPSTNPPLLAVFLSAYRRLPPCVLPIPPLFSSQPTLSIGQSPPIDRPPSGGWDKQGKQPPLLPPVFLPHLCSSHPPFVSPPIHGLYPALILEAINCKGGGAYEWLLC